MKTYETYSTHFLDKGEKYDFFIYAPHAGYDKEWIPFIKKTLVKDDFSDEVLYSYIKHEADLGSREISTLVYEKLKKFRPDLKFLLILGVVPRAFCDLNRDLEIAIPKIVKRELWEELNDCGVGNIENLIQNSNIGLHLHTMNSKNNTKSWHFGPEISENNLRNFLDNGYSGSERNDNILTHHSNGNYHSHEKLDNLIINYWEKSNITLDKNVAYKFENHFSATHLVSKIPSSLIEIKKGNLATKETKDFVDASKIELDERMVEKYSNLITEIILEFLK